MPIFNMIDKMLAMTITQQSNYNMLDALSQIQISVLENEKQFAYILTPDLHVWGYNDD